MKEKYNPIIKKRFRKFYPVVVDLETGGLQAATDAILEIAVVTLNCDEAGKFYPLETKHHHVLPFEGANIDPKSLEINHIDPFHPFRMAVPEEQALDDIFRFITRVQLEAHCTRTVLVGHNAWFDLGFLNAALRRTKLDNNPFHSITCFDTATLGGVLYGQTTLSRLLTDTKLGYDADEHHSALYDAQQTARLFCHMLNSCPWPR